MQNLVTLALLLALHLPAHAQASSLACVVRPARSGQPVCWCKASRPGSRWQVYPMIICQIVAP